MGGPALQRFNQRVQGLLRNSDTCADRCQLCGGRRLPRPDCYGGTRSESGDDLLAGRFERDVASYNLADFAGLAIGGVADSG